MEMIPKLIWLALLLLFCAAEAATVGLTSIWFAAGALAALIAALAGGPVWLQVTLFIVISLLCLIAVRPLARRYLNPKIQPHQCRPRHRHGGAGHRGNRQSSGHRRRHHRRHCPGVREAKMTPRSPPAPWCGCCASKASKYMWNE